jgi:hypothetical protein
MRMCIGKFFVAFGAVLLIDAGLALATLDTTIVARGLTALGAVFASLGGLVVMVERQYRN